MFRSAGYVCLLTLGLRFITSETTFSISLPGAQYDKTALDRGIIIKHIECIIRCVKTNHNLEFMFMKHYAPNRCEPRIEVGGPAGEGGGGQEGGCEPRI